MPLYEHVFLARQDISSQQVESLTETFQNILKEGDGTVAKHEYWGLKTLAYKIKKNRKAHFSFMNIDAPHEVVAEMERQMRISTDILRFMTIRVAEHDSDPSAMMRRGDRDDRRGGRRDRDGPRHGRSGPREGRSGPREDRSGPREERSGPREERSGPREERSGPREDRSGPREERSGPREERSGPREERSKSGDSTTSED